MIIYVNTFHILECKKLSVHQNLVNVENYVLLAFDVLKYLKEFKVSKRYLCAEKKYDFIMNSFVNLIACCKYMLI